VPQNPANAHHKTEYSPWQAWATPPAPPVAGASAPTSAGAGAGAAGAGAFPPVAAAYHQSGYYPPSATAAAAVTGYHQVPPPSYYYDRTAGVSATQPPLPPLPPGLPSSKTPAKPNYGYARPPVCTLSGYPKMRGSSCSTYYQGFQPAHQPPPPPSSNSAPPMSYSAAAAKNLSANSAYKHPTRKQDWFHCYICCYLAEMYAIVAAAVAPPPPASPAPL